MLKTILKSGVAVVFSVIIAAGCGNNKLTLADEKEIIKTMTWEMTSLTLALEKVKTHKEIAKAFNDYAANMKKIKPKMDALKKKYPKISNAPKELEAEVNALLNASEKMKPLFTKMFKYSKDPEVAAAIKKMKEVLK